MPNLIVEYESTNHLQPLFVKGTRCSARSSVGDNVVSPSLDIIFCTSGQMAELPAVGNKVTGLDVAIASLVLLSRIASNGAKGRSCETSGHDLRSVCIQCIACDGSCLSSTSRPRRTASEEKSTLTMPLPIQPLVTNASRSLVPSFDTPGPKWSTRGVVCASGLASGLGVGRSSRNERRASSRTSPGFSHSPIS